MLKQPIISDFDRAFISKYLLILELAQSELADLAKVSKSWLSNVLRGHRTRIDPDMFERVVDVLTRRATDFNKRGKISDEQTREIIDFMNRFYISAEESIQEKIFPPGEPVPTNARNYVEREVLKTEMKALQDPPFAILIHGPVLCGKSTFLQTFGYMSREKGIETAYFDPRQHIPFSLSKKPNSLELNSILAKALAEMLQTQWGFEQPEESSKLFSLTSLVNWLKKSLYPTATKQRLLIIDDIGRMGVTAAEEWFRTVIRALVNNRATSGTIGLSIAVGMTYYGFGESIERRILEVSSLISWSAPPTELSWFSRDEVKKLKEQINIPVPKDVDLYKLFAGQPYLSHYAIVDNNFRDAVQSWIHEKKAEAKDELAQRIRSFKSYRKYSSAMRQSIIGTDWDRSGDAGDLVKVFYKIVKQSNYNPFKRHKTFFETINLIKNDNTLTTPINSLLAEDLYKEFLESQ